ncbi:MAG TPA: prepilin-type N-terminal cleavage/methylation domain-containing protein [Myxococcaceae bacterium]|jgi:type IV pilus assembly protein PilW
MRRTSQARGFTLIELLTSVVVLVLVLATVAATFTGVQRTYQLQAQVKSAVEGARASSTYLNHLVNLAGYGIDPVYAFDFQTLGLPGLTKDNAPGVFPTDDLAFRYRDPAYMRRGAMNAAGNTLTLDGGAQFGIPLKDKTPLIIACKGAREAFVGYTNGAVLATATSANVQTSATPPFNAPPLSVATPCMKGVSGLNAAYVMLLHEVRIRVVGLGNPARPYLVVFHNLAAPDPLVNTDFDPIAADVENFQIAYMMNRPIPNGLFTAQAPVDQASAGPQNPNWVLGDSGSDPAEVVPNAATAPVPTYDVGYDAQARYNNHPANIRAVRLTAVLRSTRPITNVREAIGIRRFDVENWLAPVPSPVDYFYRTTSVTTVRVPNMASRSAFNPFIKELVGDDPELNIGGG